MSKHTPGPWKLVSKNAARNFNDISVRPVISPVKGLLLPIAKVSRFMPQNMAEANANLIAAAPDLLEELKKITRHFLTTTDPEVAALVRSSLDAIAKAIGEPA
jgi:hypothetical protein